MILLLGSSMDKVYPRVVNELERSRQSFSVVDEDYAARYQVIRDQKDWRIYGGGCDGRQPVGAIFVRHAVARTLDAKVIGPMAMLQVTLNQMLLSASCPVINHPSKAFSNYSKPYQLDLLAAAGFDVPRTLVTNIPDEALWFYEKCGGRVIFKGTSNVMSFAQVWRGEHFERVKLLPNSPTQFQEFVDGYDYRVHVIDDRTFVTRLHASNEDYRRSALADQENILAEPAELPRDVTERCICFTRQLGLIVSGIDFKESSGGRLVALELNPFPQFTFYEGRSGQSITRQVVEYLSRNQAPETNVFV